MYFSFYTNHIYYLLYLLCCYQVISGLSYNESADLYSMGVIVWEILTGVCPFEGLSTIDIAIGVVKNNTRPEIPSYCTSTQVKFINTCWNSNPTHRYTAGNIQLYYYLLINYFIQY
jgi:serine/threonine protein kinase